jgi:hypothetical protein
MRPLSEENAAGETQRHRQERAFHGGYFPGRARRAAQRISGNQHFRIRAGMSAKNSRAHPKASRKMRLYPLNFPAETLASHP